MKLLLVIILVGGAFFGGYHFGHREGSPDLTGWVQQAYPKVVQAGRDAIASVSAAVKPADAAKPAADQGDVYRAATDAVQKQVQAHPEWDPRYWNDQTPQTRQP
jgi:hypothetical protein